MLLEEQISSLDGALIPAHVAIIPDGNRRWAKSKSLERASGHQQGADGLMDIVRTAKQIGVKAITFYTFSTENWSRSEGEVEGLMWLIESYLENQLPTLLEEGVRFNTIGDLSPLPLSLQNRIAFTKEQTVPGNEINLTLALNYGSKDEIIRACRKLASKVASKEIEVEEISENLMREALDTVFLPDPDLLIRTSGECRLSNFMLWQLSYSEIFISPVLWPDFTPRHFLEAVQAFQKRERRIGGDSGGVCEQ